MYVNVSSHEKVVIISFGSHLLTTWLKKWWEFLNFKLSQYYFNVILLAQIECVEPFVKDGQNKNFISPLGSQFLFLNVPPDDS